MGGGREAPVCCNTLIQTQSEYTQEASLESQMKTFLLLTSQKGVRECKCGQVEPMDM